MAKQKNYNHKQTGAASVAPAAHADTDWLDGDDEPEVQQAESVPEVKAPAQPAETCKVLSQREGPIVAKCGTIRFNDIVEMPRGEAEALVKQFPELRIV